MTKFDESLHPRQRSGEFASKINTAPAVGLAGLAPSTPDNTRYTLLVGGRPHTYREPGGKIAFAEELPGMPILAGRDLSMLESHAADKGREGWVLRAEQLDASGHPIRSVDVPVTTGPGKLLVLEHDGSFMTVSDLDARGITLIDCEPHDEEVLSFPHGPDSDPIELDSVRAWLSDGGNPVSEVVATAIENRKVAVDVTVYENLLWSDRFTEAELDANEDIVADVYREWFNAELEDFDSWEQTRIVLHSEIDDHRATPLLILEQTQGLYSKYLNQTDPGTFNSPYVGTEIRARIDARTAETERAKAALVTA